MGFQFSDEFLLGYRAGHRDGFADAVQLMRNAVTSHREKFALRDRENRLAELLHSGCVPEGDENGKDVSGNGHTPLALPAGRRRQAE
jgi:hypothetical protein